ncbi:hypothetical protein PHAVU_011G171000 [Phaseolus vulgaris]|uniref:RING-type E3 ubiquitin transferase n=1 Tax=Phaseolus vulgaris TaxID=3885 RepID=V7AIF9_PHAVU|nr:hypothetical protein PHAVU_011G171000g [Phaseolus vulgaris]ESW05329.1 hypothetical protein PHAVU_011G171000g [Phaseolus vulgaris]
MRRRSSSTNSVADNIQGQVVSNPVVSRPLTVVAVVAEAAGECTMCLEGWQRERTTAGKSSSFSPKLAYILLVVFIIVFFFVSFIYFYMRRSSTHPATADNIQGQALVASRPLIVVAVVAEAAGECSIYLEGVAEGEDVKMTAHCRHIFHANCIDTWLENHVTCPVCRHSEMGGEEELVTVGGGGGGGGEEEDATK